MILKINRFYKLRIRITCLKTVLNTFTRYFIKQEYRHNKCFISKFSKEENIYEYAWITNKMNKQFFNIVDITQTYNTKITI